VVFKEVGLAGYVQMSFFIILLLVGLFYVWKHGGLDWREALKK
jgi:NADH-quinone oxidoreductase subunit A